MDIASIVTRFEDELAAIRHVKSPRSRKYSAPLKKAILDLNASGMPLDKIRVGLGLSGGAFKNWAAQAAVKKRQKAAFVPMSVETSQRHEVPLPGAVLIELPSGVKVRLFY